MGERTLAHALHEPGHLSTQPARPLHGVGLRRPGTGTSFPDGLMDADSTLIAPADRRAAAGGLTQRAHDLWTSAKGLVHDHTLLALLEVQRASLGLVKIIGAAVVISVLAVSAWMGLVAAGDRKSTRLNSSHMSISYAVFCLK